MGVIVGGRLWLEGHSWIGLKWVEGFGWGCGCSWVEGCGDGWDGGEIHIHDKIPHAWIGWVEVHIHD